MKNNDIMKTQRDHGNDVHSTGTYIPNRVFVGGIADCMTETQLFELFSTFGRVRTARIIQDKNGSSRGYGFVTYESVSEAKWVRTEMPSVYFGDRRLNVAAAVKKQGGVDSTQYQTSKNRGKSSSSGNLFLLRLRVPEQQNLVHKHCTVTDQATTQQHPRYYEQQQQQQQQQYMQQSFYPGAGDLAAWMSAGCLVARPAATTPLPPPLAPLFSYWPHGCQQFVWPASLSPCAGVFPMLPSTGGMTNLVLVPCPGSPAQTNDVRLAQDEWRMMQAAAGSS